MTDDADATTEEDAGTDPAVNGDPVDGASETETGSESGSDADATAEGLAARVAEATDSDGELADEVAALETRVAELESETDELRAKLKRKQADFQNYKKRSKRQQEQLRERATEDLVERLVPVRDNLLRALDQEEGTDIRPGVESTLSELDRVLDDENVTVVEPAPGDEVDPHRHEVMMRVDADQPEGTVVDLYQPGYEMGEKVLRPAQVTVSTGDGDGDGDEDEDA
jgi:molecular chaperone GrpE